MIEKGAFYVLENKVSDAIRIIKDGYIELVPELREQTIGRIIYIFNSIGERQLATQYSIEDMKIKPALHKLIPIIIIGIIGNPLFLD